MRSNSSRNHFQKIEFETYDNAWLTRCIMMDIWFQWTNQWFPLIVRHLESQRTHFMFIKRENMLSTDSRSRKKKNDALHRDRAESAESYQGFT
uniref:Uncharacterized protein n=1 Tax=Tanacetum cinerariifolium TaxID=118510 RepID=A0A6L2JAL0_TANCI|nr:hypothetical protein [Tanacetum cinerariifolium]